MVMQKVFKILFPIGVLVVILFQYRDIIQVRFSAFMDEFIAKLSLESVPCEKPTPYTLGTFDTKFGISQKYFLSALLDAEAIWEKPFGKELFVYNADEKSDNSLKINLVYDYRQEATSKLASLGIVVGDSRASYESLKSKLTALKTEYEKAKNALDGQVKIFNQQQLAYEEEVNSWNKKRGG